jgi:hypothetical protein
MMKKKLKSYLNIKIRDGYLFQLAKPAINIFFFFKSICTLFGHMHMPYGPLLYFKEIFIF